MLNKLSLSSIVLAGFFMANNLNAQSQTMASGASLAVAETINNSLYIDSEDNLPYAEPIFGIEKEEYENHFNEYREGSLMDRVLDLENMELQAIYADSKMNEINVSFNSMIQQEVVVAIYDSFGAKVMYDLAKIDHGINNYKVDTKGLRDGFYSMVVTGKKDQFIQRFIIE